MSSNPKPWQEKVDVSLWDYFNPPWMLPHIGLIKLVEMLEKKYGKTEAHKLLDQVAADLCRDAVLKTKREKVIDCFQDALDFLGEFMSVVPGNEYAHETEGVKRTDSKSVFHIKKCIWADSFKKMNAQEIGFIWGCKQDYVLASAIDPRFKLKRSKTLMQGDDCCDFTWYLEEKREE